MKKNTFIHTFLFLVLSFVYIFLISSVTVSPSQGIRTFFLFTGILFVLAFIIYRVMSNWQLVSVILSIFVISLLSTPTLFQVEIIISGIAIFCVYVFSYFKKRRVDLNHFINILNLVSIVMFIFMLTVALIKLPAGSLNTIVQYSYMNRQPEISLTTKNNMPDIYYIVLDGYGREDILHDYYNYDNSEFIENLEAKGFVIPSDSHSNYVKTILSISSTLNMNYIGDVLPELDNKQSHYWWLLKPLIEYSEVRVMLEEIGYTSYAISSGWGLTENSSFDHYYQPSPPLSNDFEFVLFSSTPLKLVLPLLSEVVYFPSYDRHRELFHYNFVKLAELSKVQGPKFIFAHLISPHPPFVFDENGQPLTPSYNFTFNDANDFKLSNEEYRMGYINQLQYLNLQIENAVNEILKNSTTPPIIILQADHGPGMLTDFNSYKNSCLRERFSNFSAYYLPNINQTLIPKDITPVNLFRIIFNGYFNTNFEILHNSHYYIREAINPFMNDDVSALVETCSVLP